MSGLITICDATVADSEEIGRLFVATDVESFTGAFGTAEAMGRYVRMTFGEGTLFSSGTVRVAREDGAVAGICITYGRELSDAPISFEESSKVGIEGLSPAFDDAMLCQVEDIRAASGMGFAYLDCLSVDEGHRRSGIGEALVRDAIERHGKVMLYCRKDNPHAIALYEKVGFSTMGWTFGISDGSDLGPEVLMMTCG